MMLEVELNNTHIQAMKPFNLRVWVEPKVWRSQIIPPLTVLINSGY